ncbi:hypothetical protein UYO_1760 [Lachnospiraceae bacterium JC7]|nr:hypothetical protein UYO_1760 [Lachnospiraceae bacterium JC7]
MILYVSKLFGDGNFAADQHYKAICEIYGEENVFTIDLSPNSSYRDERYIAYGKCKSPIHRIGRWLQGNMQYISSGIISEILGIISEKNITDVFIEDSVFGNLVCRIKKQFPEVRVICFYHDIKYVLYKEWIKKLPLHNKIELSIGRIQEKLSQKYSDVELVFNEREALLYEKVYGEKPDDIILLSAPDPFDSSEVGGNIMAEIADHLDDEEKVILFVGKNYYPNLNGIRWFIKEVLPRVDVKCQLWIVGRGLEFLRPEILEPRVKVIGGVESLDEYYKKANLVITPLFEGGGMKLKTLEALSYGKRVLGTKESFIGVWEYVPEDIKQIKLFSSENASDWTEWINKELNTHIPLFDERVYELYKNEFSYEVMKKKFENVLMER